MAEKLWQRRVKSTQRRPQQNRTDTRPNRYSQNREQLLISSQVSAAAGYSNAWMGQLPASPSVTTVHSLVEQWCAIRDVWQSNLEEEFQTIRGILDEYPVVALKMVCADAGTRPARVPYHQMKQQVQTSDMHQLGLTFTDTTGRLRPGTSVWQFNFRPTRTRNGIKTQDNRLTHPIPDQTGIDVTEFAELLTSSGIVLNRNMTCISFNSAQDFGHVIRLLTGGPLPDSEQQFRDLLSVYFPVTYDVKYLTESVRTLTGSDLRSVSVIQFGLLTIWLILFSTAGEWNGD